MKSSWKIGTLFGVAIGIHATFPLLVLWVAALDFGASGDGRKITVGVAFTLAIFGLVVLHELGHALVAMRFGVRTREITLFPLGGVARLERIPRRPAHALWISLAGPAVNAALAILVLQIDPVRATDIAVMVGKGLAVLLGIVGVATNAVLARIAVFVWFGAEQEGGATPLRPALEGVPLEDVMMREFHVLSPEDLRRARGYSAARLGQYSPKLEARAA